MNTYALLYHHYMELSNKRVEIQMKNGKLHKGILTAFYKEDEEIYKWRLVNNECVNNLDIDTFNFNLSIFIPQKEMAQILFLQSGLLIRF